VPKFLSDVGVVGANANVGARVDAGLGFRHGAPSTPSWTTGTGSPEGAVTAPVGSIFSRSDGGANSALYRKESGAGNTGWTAMGAGGLPVGGSASQVLTKKTAADYDYQWASPPMNWERFLSVPLSTTVNPNQTVTVDLVTFTAGSTGQMIADLAVQLDWVSGGTQLTAVDLTPSTPAPTTAPSPGIVEDVGITVLPIAASWATVTNGQTVTLRVALSAGAGTSPIKITACYGTYRIAGISDSASSLPGGGTTGQALVKRSATDFDAQWQDIAAGGVSSVDGRTGVVTLADKYVDVTGDNMTGNLGMGVPSPTAKLQLAADTTAPGGILFGTDTTLYRSASSMLKTDGKITVAGGQVIINTPTGTDSGVLAVRGPFTDGTTRNSYFFGSNGVVGAGWTMAADATATQFLADMIGFYQGPGRPQGGVQGQSIDIRISGGNGSWGSLGAYNPSAAAATNQVRTVTGFTGTITGDYVGVQGKVSHLAAAGTISGSMAALQAAPPGFTAGGTVTGNVHGVRVANQGNAGWATAYGIRVDPVSGSTATNTGIAIGAAAGKTLHVSDTADSITAAGGITFGLSGDTNLYRSAADTLSTDDTMAAAKFRQGAAGPTWTSGTGSPEGVVTAPVGSTYSRTDGGAGTAVYRKEVGTGNTGWVADTTGADPTLYVKIAGDTMTGPLQVRTATTPDATAEVTVAATAVGRKPLVLQGLAGQTANLLEVQASTGGTPLAHVSNAGSVGGTDFRLNGAKYGIVGQMGTPRSLYPFMTGTWADRFQHTTISNCEYWDGSAWAALAATVVQEIFSGHPASTVTLNSTTYPKWRVTFSGVSSSYAAMLFLYQEYPPKGYKVTLEESADALAWTTLLAETTVVDNTYYATIPTTISYGNYHRLTIEHTTPANNYAWKQIRFFSDRMNGAGGQQLGFPFTWQYNKDFRFQGNVGAGTAPITSTRMTVYGSGNHTSGGGNMALRGQMYWGSTGDATSYIQGNLLLVGTTVPAGFTHTNGATEAILGTESRADIGGDGNYASSASGLMARVNKSGTGTLNYAKGLLVYSPSVSGGGAVTTAIGLDISTQKAAGVTTGYGIRQNGSSDLNYFGGLTGLGVLVPTARLQLAADTLAAGGILFGTDTNLYRSAADTLKTDDSILVGVRVDALSGFRHGDATKPSWTTGTGTPEGVVTAPVGSLFSRTDGGANTALYRKETGTGNTGWVSVSTTAAGLPTGGTVTQKLRKNSSTDYDTQWIQPWTENAWVGPNAPTGTPSTGDVWYDTDDVSTLVLPLSVANGGTGATTAQNARAALAVPDVPVPVVQGGTGATTAALARSGLAVPAIGNSTTTGGAPTTGTWARGDQWLDSLNVLWLCTTAGTPGTWVSKNIGEELFYGQITTGVTVTQTTAAGSILVVDGGTRSYDGTTAIIIEVYAPLIQAPAGTNLGIMLELYDNASDLGILCETYTGATPANSITTPAYARRRLTPTAGSHNFRIGAWVHGGTGTVFAGTGLSGGFSPAFIRITRA
jgi:hypothetical protein